jgi:hypothetical protein
MDGAHVRWKEEVLGDQIDVSALGDEILCDRGGLVQNGKMERTIAFGNVT